MTDKTILVVNDEKYINQAIVEQLKNRGFTNITTAFNGKEALDKIKEISPHLIISDINMPYIDGWRLCTILRESKEHHDTPFILMSATYGNLTAEQMAREVGASAFIQAPYDEAELIAVVHKLLTGKESPLKGMAVAVKRKVLLADADSYVCGRLGPYLVDEGNEVMTASDGETALEMIKSERPDILFLAYRLPKMGGRDVLRQVREIYHPLITMMTTPTEYTEIRRDESLLWWVDECIKKPFQMSDIPGICDRVFRKYNMRRLDEQFRERVYQLTASRGELNTILDSLVESVVIVNQNDEIQYGNRKIKNIIGDKPAAESCYRVIYGREERCKECERDKVIKEGKSRTFERILTDGRHLIVTQSPLKMQDGTTSCLEVVNDITEVVKIKEMLIHQEKLAEIGEMVSGVAHELNNSLTGVIGYSELLSESKEIKSERGKQDIQILLREAQRCNRIVANLLNFARMRKPEKKVIYINEAVEKTIDLRTYHLKTNNIECVKEFEPHIPPVRGDFYQLEQVFLNLINNAVYAMKESHGKGRLTIRTKAAPLTPPLTPPNPLFIKEGEKGGVKGVVRIEFENDGPAIPGEILEKIFEPFFTTKREKGTGLGLSVSSDIIKGHGGRIWAESPISEQGGARFVIDLPVN